jgi:hypothetical protein
MRIVMVVAALAALDGCGSGVRSRRDDVPHTLASSRRLHYVVAPAVAIPGEQGAVIAPGMTDELRRWVEVDMAQLGMDAEEDPGQAHDVEVRLALSMRRAGAQALGRGAMQVRADGRVLEVWSTAERAASPPDQLPRQLARELVDELACSPRVAAHADALYGRRTRPLRETAGRRAFVADEAPPPPLEGAGGGSYRTNLRCPESAPDAASRAR